MLKSGLHEENNLVLTEITDGATMVVRQRKARVVPVEAGQETSKPPALSEAKVVALQRANAEQARRVNQCLRSFQSSLISCLAQPAVFLDREGNVKIWNESAAEWSQIASSSALDQHLLDLLPAYYAEPLLEVVLQASLSAETATNPDQILPFSITLRAPFGSESLACTAIPLCQTPGCVAGCLLLLAPSEIVS